jgi:hypothetical protein
VLQNGAFPQSHVLTRSFGKVERSRIIIDPQSFGIYGPSGPGLGPIETRPRAESDTENLLLSVRDVIYNANSQAFREFEIALESHEKSSRHNLPRGCESAFILLEPRKELCLISVQQSLSVLNSACCALRSYEVFASFLKHGVRAHCKRLPKKRINVLAEFNVENVRPITWNDNAFPRLVLPYGYKEIIRAFVGQQLSRDDEFRDIVQEKGTDPIFADDALQEKDALIMQP